MPDDVQPQGNDQPRQDLPPGLKPRDFRRALRIARQNGLDPENGREAYRMLLDRGIDVSAKRRNLLEHTPDVVQDGTAETGQVMLPQDKVDALLQTDAQREAEIARIQRDLVKRRRSRLRRMLLRLTLFVFLPTAVVGYYYFNIATDIYETKTEFVIHQSGSPNQVAGFSSLLSGTGFANSKDSMQVQGYLTSREAMLRLDGEHAFIDHYKQESIDPIQRLPADASMEDAFKTYEDAVTVGFDPSEGIVKMSVKAASPEKSQEFAEALITYAEEKVDQSSQRVRDDQMKGALESVDRAEQNMRDAQARVLSLQEELGVVSSEAELTARMSVINSLELELEQEYLTLAEIQANARPNAARVAFSEGEIARLENRINTLRGQLTETGEGSQSLARVTAELRIAEAELATRQLLLQEAVAQLETSRVEANRQVLYLSMGVAPIAPDVASHPKRLENTLLAFLIFFAIYILVSLTVSVLREQVSV
ncbi:capsule biosynthesis protein [Oceanomicrobium pacificus]|uniref:Capsule biosynthesis protein n=1 Tax=Oceanomicrobium pacificus TaxID=2692916 RepID=A0A6B0TS73_9RHOB|nr:capsule biosynthesis protein [Oceanomicrobium pacificus]MXU64655.1 capsule biosynthesis protein [Oceanomicrobium pacificus]